MGFTLQRDDTGVPVAGYDAQDDMVKVKSMQKKFRDSFTGAALDTNKWEVATQGTGTTYSVSGGILTMGSGTTANAVLELLSKDIFTVPFRATFQLTLSQRIANQTFLVEAVSVNPATGVPDGQHVIAWVFDGTSATQAKYRVGNGGVTPLDSGASTIVTTAGTGIYEMEPFADEAWFHSGTLDSTAGRANSYRRHQQIPDPNAVYKLRLKWLNGSSVPASNTNATLQFVACQDYAELTAEITAGRGQAVAGQGVGVNVIGTVPVSDAGGSITVDGTITANLTTPSAHTLNSAASTNATSIKASAGTVSGISISNIAASTRFVKLYNKASAPTVGTDVPVLTIPIPAGTSVTLNIGGAYGHRFTTGIALAITGAAADNDTTAIGASEVKVMTSYI